MGQEFSIWTPVIASRLMAQHINEEKKYETDKIYKSVEDLKIKIKELQVNLQGQSLEARIRIDILCLLEDLLGTMHLFTRAETIRQRISLLEFDTPLDRDKDYNYIMDVYKLEGQGELVGKEIRVNCFIDYVIMAVREQVVRLTKADEGDTDTPSLENILSKLREEVARVNMEKEELRRKNFLYERDIASLKKGIRKAERQNTKLDKEIGYYQQLVEQLREAVAEKEMRLNGIQNNYYPGNGEALTRPKESDISLGSRIKRMFSNN